MFLTQGCALTTPDFGPRRLAANDAGDSPDAGSCSTGHWLHADTSIPDEGIGDLLFVQRTVDLGDMSADAGPAMWTPADLPIPKPCTNPVSGLTMKPNLDNGRSALGQSSHELAQSSPFTVSAFFNESASNGTSATLIRIVGYNGQADDDLIEVDVAQGGCMALPSWGGTDRWGPFIDYATKAGADYTPNMFSTMAKVHEWTIDVVLDAPRSPPYTRPIQLHATISRASNLWHLLGEASARVLTIDMLQLTQSLGVCPGTNSYDTDKGVYCSHADLDSDGDGTCDSLSDTWTFEAWEARLGCMQPAPDASCPTNAQPDDCARRPTPDASSPADAAE
jgi:hypothetical protein